MSNLLLAALVTLSVGTPGDTLTMTSMPNHAMPVVEVSDNWRLSAMAQAFPIWSGTRTPSGNGTLEGSSFYLTQPAAMVNLERADGSIALRFTPNFEFATLADGERTTGGWGEGFIDSRHPHTAVHELMLSYNHFGESVSWSLSAGKGFAPYGTEDPMSRPVVKYPTNHHLSQILERFTLNGVVMASGWSLEAGLFGGSEPEGPWDFSNVNSFGDSWSLRLTRRLGAENAWGTWPLEIAGSWARVNAEHHGEAEAITLANAQLRADASYGFGRLYGLIEASRSDAEGDDEDFWSVLGEVRFDVNRHQPYARVEWATRPEYDRDAASGDGFFRYDHDAHIEGSTRWTLVTLGYGYAATRGAVSLRPFAEVQWARMFDRPDGPDVSTLFRETSAVGLTLGARVYLGGDPMRMGTYGVLDPMTRMRVGPAGMGGMHGMDHGGMHHN
jgi:hypothetical protein